MLINTLCSGTACMRRILHRDSAIVIFVEILNLAFRLFLLGIKAIGHGRVRVTFRCPFFWGHLRGYGKTVEARRIDLAGFHMDAQKPASGIGDFTPPAPIPSPCLLRERKQDPA